MGVEGAGFGESYCLISVTEGHDVVDEYTCLLLIERESTEFNYFVHILTI